MKILITYPYQGSKENSGSKWFIVNRHEPDVILEHWKAHKLVYGLSSLAKRQLLVNIGSGSPKAQ